jgi:hypothetical protein
MPARVAVFAALTRAADSARAGGDSRSRGQVMADALVTRVTGQAQADDVPVMVNLVMTDAALLGGSDEVARVAKYGPVPSGVASLLTTTGRAWVRRLYVHPSTGSSSRWRHGLGASLLRWPSWCGCVTSSAGRPTATHRSGISTT